MMNNQLPTVICLLPSVLRIFTSVERPLQIDPFMQNKPNFQKSQMNVSTVLTEDYENKSNWTLGENKPNSKPIKPNFRKAEMNLNFYLTKDYENVPLRRRGENKPNQTQSPLTIQQQLFPLFSPNPP